MAVAAAVVAEVLAATHASNVVKRDTNRSIARRAEAVVAAEVVAVVAVADAAVSKRLV